MQSVGQEIAQTEQTMQSLQHSKSYLESNSAHIDRNFNESVLEKVMELHPEVGSKAGAAQWISEHSHESDQIASGLMSVYNPFEHQSSASRDRGKAQELRNIDQKINDTPIMAKKDLDDKYYSKSSEREQQASVIDNSGNQLSIKQAVEQSIAHAKENYQGNPRQVLYNNLSQQERASAEALRSSVPEMITSRTTALENQYNDTSSSTVVRTKDQFLDNTKNTVTSGKEFIKGLIKNDDK